MAGCLFVERRKRNGLDEEIKGIKDVLLHKINVCIFPEATSTNGEQILQFKRPLFKACTLAFKNVVPVTLNYLKLNEERVNIENRDKIFWYGDMSFFPHLKEVLELSSIKVKMTVEKELWDPDYSNLANLSYQKVSSHYLGLSI